MKKRIMCLIGCLVLLSTLLTGCAEWEKDVDPLGTLSEYYHVENTEEPLRTIQTFTLPYLSNQTMDPITCDDGIQQTVGALLYESLYELDGQFRPHPCLAAAETYDPETFTYTITLRKGISFSDGSPLEAKDVVNTLERARLSSRYSGRLRAVEKIKVNEKEDTIALQLSEDNRSFTARLDIPVVKSGTEDNTVPVGTGPYVWVVGESGPYLTPSPLWWQNTTRPFPRIDLLSYKSDDAAMYAFTAREIHLFAYDPTSSEELPHALVGDYTDVQSPEMLYLGYHIYEDGVFADAALRAAVNASFDRSGLIDSYLMGHGQATQFPISPISANYPAELEEPYQPERFYEALAEKDFVSDHYWLSARFIVNEENHFKVAIAKELLKVLNTGDLHVTLDVLPWEEFTEAILEGEYDLFLGDVRLPADWDSSTLVGSGGMMNYGGYYDVDTDLLLQEYLSAEEGSRPLITEKLCRKLLESAPITPLLFKEISVLTTDDLLENLHPTWSDPFYQMESWRVHLDPSIK